jgi:hypothetical protein
MGSNGMCDSATGKSIVPRAMVMQRKLLGPIQFEITDLTRGHLEKSMVTLLFARVDFGFCDWLA